MKRIELGLKRYLVYGSAVITLSKNEVGDRGRRDFFSISVLQPLAGIALVALLVPLAGCENFDLPVDDEGSSSTRDAGTAPVRTTAPDSGGAVSSMDAGPAGPEPNEGQEPTELKTDFVVAQAGKDLIFVPNPANHVVTAIDPQSLGIRFLPAGNRPTYLAACPAANVAVAIDKGAGRAAVIRVSRASFPDPVMVDVGRGANAVAFSPRCLYAVVYYDPEYVGEEDSTGGYQEVSVIDLAQGDERSVRITVGLRPREIIFEKEGKGAFFVTEDGVSTVTFADVFGDDADSALAETVDFGSELETGKVQIGLSPYGRFVTGYEKGKSQLYLLDNATETLTSLDMVEVLNASNEMPDAGTPAADGDAGVEESDESEPTEEAAPLTEAAISQVTIAPSGRFALVSIPEPGVVLKIKIPGGFDEPSTIVALTENEANDSAVIDPEEMTALIFDRAGRGSYLKVVDLEAEEAETRRVRLAGPVDEIHYAPGGKTALILHNSEGAPWEFKATGFSALAVDSGAPPRFYATSVPPGSYLFSSDAGAMFMLLRDDALGTRQLLRVSLDSLLVEPIDLERRPRGLGVMPNVDRVLVDHVHPDGHVALFDWTGAITDSLVGYQIVDRIKE